MKKITLILFLTSFLHFSCNDDDCKDGIIDLITNLAVDASVTILAGAPFDVSATIQNAISVIDDCTASNGNESGPSVSNYKVNFGEEENNFTEEEMNQNFDIPSIMPDDQFNDDFETTFMAPGFYELITITDVNDSITEENEDNNTFVEELGFRISSPNVVIGNPLSRLVIEVLPNPDFVWDGSTPKVLMVRK